MYLIVSDDLVHSNGIKHCSSLVSSNAISRDLKVYGISYAKDPFHSSSYINVLKVFRSHPSGVDSTQGTQSYIFRDVDSSPYVTNLESLLRISVSNVTLQNLSHLGLGEKGPLRLET